MSGAGSKLDLVVLGLSLSSSWGNGHATTYRALLKALAGRGHRILFLERDRPWYAENRDLRHPDYCDLQIYDVPEDLAAYSDRIRAADAVVVGSFVPDGRAVARFVQAVAGGVTAFYDIDTPVTLSALASGRCEYLTPQLIRGFDLYLSFTGGPTLNHLEIAYGARRARALFCAADGTVYRPLGAPKRWDLGYLGTYSACRQPALERLLLESARHAPEMRFVIAGPQYPDTDAWPANVEHIAHVPPAHHPDFYAAARWTLNVTRADMAAAGYSPSVRLFEAAACGAAILTDRWEGLETVFEPGRELVPVETTEDVLRWLAADEAVRAEIGRRGRERFLREHEATRRAEQLERYLTEVLGSSKRETRGLARAHGF